jgi:hypothetical protein
MLTPATGATDHDEGQIEALIMDEVQWPASLYIYGISLYAYTRTVLGSCSKNNWSCRRRVSFARFGADTIS